MSAWIVSKKHIDLMVAGIMHRTRDRVVPPHEGGYNPDALGQMFVKECVASVSYRYPDDKPGELPGPCDGYYLKRYTFEDPGYLPTVAELYKAIDCYCYQSCEHRGWEKSKALKVCDAVRAVIAARVPGCAQMSEKNRIGDWSSANPWPEYKAAPWGFEAEDIEALAAQAK
ncbi:MAG: hypothetical protein L0Z62_08050 [Gemmataceae bacterium]|nr:hypothetical protein [Gemmataceae bacterium]